MTYPLISLCFTAVLFRDNGNSYTASTESDMYIYTYSSQYREAGREKGIKKYLAQHWMQRTKEIVPRPTLGPRAIGSSALGYSF